MFTETRKAIVFNCQYNGLSIIQELGSKKIPCIAMDYKKNIGAYSKYGEYVKCPDPMTNEKQFVDFLYDYCSKENLKPILFPTNDQWAKAISKFKEKLSEVAIPSVSDFSVTSLLLEKQKFYDYCVTKNYPVPKTWALEEVELIEEKTFPLIAKPEYRKHSSDNEKTKHLSKNLDRLRFTVLKDRNELIAFITKEKEFTQYLIFQELVQGMSNSMYTVGVYADKAHQIKGLFTGKKIRGYPADTGDCVVGESTLMPEEIINLTRNLVQELKIQGIVEFEYKKDTVTGDYKLIEINPRSWSWIGITPECGVNLPLIAYEDHNGNKNSILKKNNVAAGEVRYTKVLQDLKNCLFLYKKENPEWKKSFKEWIKDYKKPEKTVFAEFHKKDYKVSCVALFSQLKMLQKKTLLFLKKVYFSAKRSNP